MSIPKYALRHLRSHLLNLRFRARYRAKRLARSWRYFADSLSADEAQQFLIDCHYAAGWHPLLTLAVEDTLEQTRRTYDAQMGPHPSNVECFDDRLRQAGKIMDWSRKVAALYGAGFIDRYMQSNANLAIRMCGVGDGKHGFLIKAAPRPHGETHGETDKSNSSAENAQSKQSAVFPGQVEIMEGTKHVVPSWIRLETFDDALVDLGKPLYLF